MNQETKTRIDTARVELNNTGENFGATKQGNIFLGETNIALTETVEVLNSRLNEFNESSEQLTQRALNLTRWIMIATIVSSIAAATLAIDVISKWIKQ